jgi:hypothetical protein
MFGLFGRKKKYGAKADALIADLRKLMNEEGVMDALMSAETTGMIFIGQKAKIDEVNSLVRAIGEETGLTPTEVGQMIRKML